MALRFDEAGSLTNRYLHGPAIDQVLVDEQVASPSSPGDLMYPLADHLGTVRALAAYDPAANSGAGETTIANHLVYDAFGQIVSESAPAVDHLFAYTGRERDDDAGLHHYRARWYDPAVGRFVSEDPIGFAGSPWLLSGYVANAPVSLRDPLGLSPVADSMALNAAVDAERAYGAYRHELQQLGQLWNAQQLVTPELIKQFERTQGALDRYRNEYNTAVKDADFALRQTWIPWLGTSDARDKLQKLPPPELLGRNIRAEDVAKRYQEDAERGKLLDTLGQRAEATETTLRVTKAGCEVILVVGGAYALGQAVAERGIVALADAAIAAAATQAVSHIAQELAHAAGAHPDDIAAGQAVFDALSVLAGAGAAGGSGRKVLPKLKLPKQAQPTRPPFELNHDPPKISSSSRTAAPPAKPCPPAVAPTNPNAAAGLQSLKGRSAKEIAGILEREGFVRTNPNNPINQKWRHPDGSEVRIHPYGNQNTGPFASGNNAHVHRQDPLGNQLNDRGVISTDPSQTHIGMPNPPDLPAVRGRPHGAGS